MRLADRLTPLALAAATFLGCLAAAGTPPWTIAGGGFTSAGCAVRLTVAGLSAVAALVVRRWRWPLLVMAVAGWLGFYMWPAMVFSSYYAATKARRRWHILVYAVVTAALIGVPLIIGALSSGGGGMAVGGPMSLVSYALMVGLPLVVGLWVTARRQVIAGLHERAERLEREQAERAELARVAERARIAREMHDVVAHRVSLMVLHAGALEVAGGDPRTAEAAALIRTTGRTALAELRQVLGVLRSGESDGRLAPQPVLADLPALLDLARSAGIPVTLTESGDLTGLAVTAQRTAYRVVQEALTNVAKHAGRAPTAVSLAVVGEEFVIQVRNAPPPHPVDRLPGSGLGLVGLRERLALLGGRLEAHPQLDGGFAVTAVLPLESAPSVGLSPETSVEREGGA